MPETKITQEITAEEFMVLSAIRGTVSALMKNQVHKDIKCGEPELSEFIAEEITVDVLEKYTVQVPLEALVKALIKELRADVIHDILYANDIRFGDHGDLVYPVSDIQERSTDYLQSVRVL